MQGGVCQPGPGRGRGYSSWSRSIGSRSTRITATPCWWSSRSTFRAGKSRRCTYTVAGWGPDSGGLWKLNTTVPIKDDLTGFTGSYLIEALTFSLDPGQGSTTQISVIHPDAYAKAPGAPVDQASKIVTRGMDKPS
jgi:prophage tail gpP-like protein